MSHYGLLPYRFSACGDGYILTLLGMTDGNQAVRRMCCKLNKEVVLRPGDQQRLSRIEGHSASQSGQYAVNANKHKP
jgi:hypothetical protein